MLKVSLEILFDVSVRLVKAQKESLVQDEATAKANEKLVKLLVPSMKKKASQTNNPLESLLEVQFQISDKITKMKKNHLLRKLKQNVLKLRDS